MNLRKAIRRDAATVYDDYEPVTVTSTRRPGSQKDANIQAFWRSATVDEKQASGGAYEAGMRTWCVPDISLPWPLKPGDTVTDGEGDTYTILTAKPDVMQTLWCCPSVNLVIAHDLQDLGDVERAERETDAAGLPLKLFPADGSGLGGVLFKSVPCRVQPVEQTHAEERGLRGQTTRFTVFVGKQLDGITTEDRFVVRRRNGATVDPPMILEIRRYSDAERIGDLPQLEAELVP